MRENGERVPIHQHVHLHFIGSFPNTFFLSSAAKRKASSTYFPVLVSLNLLHLFITYSRGNFSFYRTIFTILQWTLTYIAYNGIINDAQASATSSISKKNQKLVGGAWLDLLFVVLLSQFGGLFFHQGLFDSMLFILPGLYFLKKKIAKGLEGDGSKPLTREEEEAKKALDERRKKRAERRRQKRGV